MPSFSRASLDLLSSCDPRLQKIAHEAIKRIDFKVTEGHRSVERQHQLFLDGNSKCDGINKKSNHNYLPSRAFDFLPCPFKGWDQLNDFKAVADVLLAVAAEQGIRVRWGGDFNGDGWLIGKDNWDKPHFEIRG